MEADDKQAFYVQCADGRKFKMVIRGDLEKLSVGKIRRYLKSYGVKDDLRLIFNGMVLDDKELGADFGLHNNAVLQLEDPVPERAAEDSREVEVVQPSKQQRKVAAQGKRTSLSDPHVESRSSATRGPVAQEDTTVQSHHADPESSLAARSVTCNSSGLKSARLASVKSNDGSGFAGTGPVGSGSRTISPTLRDENRQLRAEVEILRRELAELQEQQHSVGNTRQKDPELMDILQNAKANLQELSEELGVPLQFDMNLTCAVGREESQTVLVTFDYHTERLYVYATLLTELPSNMEVRVKLYEVLLEGSLLGREVCGGGIGLSLRDSVVLLSTTIPLRCCTSSALKETMPIFIETLQRWRSLINELLS
uniref:Ubiquitin-like domain-containing protein n=1 Tax=Trypanosoma vivax (strain Y486) TaxID=1055687 RepID=G0U7K9_TRYVY|nr:conserved hypothetical protein [Trypanosoma vivax Y486]